MATATYPSSLEIVLDRATDQYARALALRRPNRLRWRGLEVSDEFQRYASRVARGEALAPYRGPVLAHACAEFPSVEVPQTEAPLWSKPQRAPAAGRLWAGSLVLLLIGLGSVIATAPNAWGETAAAWLGSTAPAARVVPAARESAVPASSPGSDSLLSNAIERVASAATERVASAATERVASAATDRPALRHPRAPRRTPLQVIPAASEARRRLGAAPAVQVPFSRRGMAAQPEPVSAGLVAPTTSALLVEAPTF